MPSELSPLERELIRRQVLAAQAQLDAILAVVGDGEECPHPENQRRYRGGTMGEPRAFECGLCQQVVTEPRPTAA